MTLPQIRYPAVPLVTHDPYFSIWSVTDQLNQDWTRHWTGAGNGLCGMLQIDGQAYRFAGDVDQIPGMQQTRVEVLPTRTLYYFTAGGVELKLTFLSPILCADLDLLSRPITYMIFDVRSLDRHTHDVTVYFDVTTDAAVDQPSQTVDVGRIKLEELTVLRAGATEQKILSRSGDNLRIDWGYLYFAGDAQQWEQNISFGDVRSYFHHHGQLPKADKLINYQRVNNGWPVLAGMTRLGKVTGKVQRRTAMLAYDDIYAIEYHQRWLPAYWRRNAGDFGELLTRSGREFPAIEKRAAAFDAELLSDAQKIGGDNYALLLALAYRQSVAAHKLVADIDGTPLYFSKENSSNGCIATVDVTYPSAPLFLLLQPKLLEAMLAPIMDYARMSRWKFPFAPHDLGQYPLANGQVYGGGEFSEWDQMPVEECGNMLILTAALLHVTGDLSFPRKYWNTLDLWARYLAEKGLDPATQLCTDDFAGRLGHNTNLSLKAIIALAAFAQIATQLKETKTAQKYRKLAEQMARQWQLRADDGDHYRLAFDVPGSWSLKYNLVWDKVLGLKLFPPEVAAKEVAFYLTKQQRYGVPLDSRKTYTKLDWLLWVATLAEDDSDFQAFLEPLVRWLNDTPSRVPLLDWFETTDGRQVSGFQARSVVGALFMKLLADSKLRKKWTQQAL